MTRRFVVLTAAFLLALQFAFPASDSFSFVILGDRTGETQPGVFEQVLRESVAAHPALVVSVGDTIQGLNDLTAEGEWRSAKKLLNGLGRIPLYLAPGNHDVWSGRSAELFAKYAGHPLHYSFDYGPAHFTILDNSRADELASSEVAFLESDLAAHAGQAVKFIVSHRPSWIVDAAFGNTQFPLHQLAKKYGVHYVIAGHVHQLIHIELDGVTYLSMQSAGGHLRASEKYADGWFFGYTAVEVHGAEATFAFHELQAPHGEGRVTSLKDWGTAGLTGRP